MALNELQSTLVEQQVPAFVREEGQKFITFLKKYLEFSEQQGRSIYEIRNFLNNTDIDLADTAMEQYFKAEFMARWPETMAADKSVIMKNIIDIYRAKGS